MEQPEATAGAPLGGHGHTHGPLTDFAGSTRAGLRALAIGGAVAGFAILSRTELLLAFIGGLFVLLIDRGREDLEKKKIDDAVRERLVMPEFMEQIVEMMASESQRLRRTDMPRVRKSIERILAALKQELAGVDHDIAGMQVAMHFLVQKDVTEHGIKKAPGHTPPEAAPTVTHWAFSARRIPTS